MDKAARLKMIRELGETRRLQELDALGVLPTSKRDVLEEVGELDSFREHVRDRATEHGGLTSDE